MANVLHSLWMIGNDSSSQLKTHLALTGPLSGRPVQEARPRTDLSSHFQWVLQLGVHKEGQVPDSSVSQDEVLETSGHL